MPHAYSLDTGSSWNALAWICVKTSKTQTLGVLTWQQWRVETNQSFRLIPHPYADAYTPEGVVNLLCF